MNKFSEDEKLEQMAYQKRRQREREHRKIVEQMIIDRRCLHAQEREREQTVLDCFDEETKRRLGHFMSLYGLYVQKANIEMVFSSSV